MVRFDRIAEPMWNCQETKAKNEATQRGREQREEEQRSTGIPEQHSHVALVIGNHKYIRAKEKRK